MEITVGALRRNVLNMLYLWVSAHSPGRISFADFLLSCPFISSDYELFLYFMCRVRPLCAF